MDDFNFLYIFYYICYSRYNTNIEHSCLVCCCWDSKSLTQVGPRKSSRGDLHQPSGIRYFLRSFSVRCFISLTYGKVLIFVVTLSIVVPQAIGIFLRNRIGNHTGEFLIISFGGFISIQCSWIALIYLFLIWV